MAQSATPPPAPFVVGVARSGTTLLRFMLDGHPELAIPAETHFIPFVLQESSASLSLQRDQFVSRITSCFAWRDFGLPEDVFRLAVYELKPFTVTDGLRTFYRLCADAKHKMRWGDKTPTYAEHIAAISQVLPEAHFIHVIRDGRAVAASRRHLAFGPGPNIVDQARDWGRKIRETRRQARSCPHYIEIRYEDLVIHTETVLCNVCTNLGLEYDPIMLDYPIAAEIRLREFQDWSRPADTLFLSGDYRRSIHQRTRLPLDSGRVDHWRHALQPGEVEAFEKEEGDFLAELGYELTASGRS